MKEIFLMRIKNKCDDYCVYCEEKQHRDVNNNIVLGNASFCGRYDEIKKEIAKGNFESYLTKEELLDFLDNSNKFDYYISKIKSAEGKLFEEKIMQEEKEKMQEEYGFTEEEIEKILENYSLEYRDKSIICGIYESVDELAEEYLFGTTDFPTWAMDYFDYAAFGNDLCCCNESYYKLDLGRIVYYSM